MKEINDMSAARTIRIIVLLYMNADGKVLLVRKRGTAVFMLPGGKPDKGETELACLEREIAEELNSTIELESIRRTGDFTDKAANEPNAQVEAVVFEGKLSDSGIAVPSAEIEEVLWHDPWEEHPQIAPLVKNQIFPLLLSQMTTRPIQLPAR